MPNESKVADAIKSILNPALKKIGLNDIRVNPDSKTVYKLSLDGTAVERLIGDLLPVFADDAPTDGLTRRGLASPLPNDGEGKVFLRALAQTYEALGSDFIATYDRFVAAIPMIRHWTIGMHLAFRLKPEHGDYRLVQEHLALYVACKLRWMAAPSTSWYDDECLYTFGRLHEYWGSLRLVSQEGMEAWQKKLNEVLRQSNGYANAGAIPKAVKRGGKKKRKAYMEKRAAERPSSAQWIYEQAMLQQHAYHADVHAARDVLRDAGHVVQHDAFSTAWRRYMVAGKFRCRLLARVRCGATWEQQALGSSPPAGDSYYKSLLREYHAYYDPPPSLTAEDLDEEEKERQLQAGRKARYAALQSVYTQGVSADRERRREYWKANQARPA